MDSDASTSPRRRSCYSDSGDSSCSEPFSECGSDDLSSFSPAAAAGIHRLLLSCAAEASDGSISSLVAELESPAASVDSLRRAAMEIRLLAKHNPDNRIRIAASGAVRPLVALLSHADPLLQEHGVTALLNLSICDENKAAIVEAGAIRPLVRALKSAARAPYRSWCPSSRPAARAGRRTPPRPYTRSATARARTASAPWKPALCAPCSTLCPTRSLAWWTRPPMFSIP